MCKRVIAPLLLLPLLWIACTGPGASSTDTAPPHPSADSLSLRWGVETNLVETDDFRRVRSHFTIENRGEVPLHNEGWTLYFNFLRSIDPSSLPASVEITHVNGDFYRLEPTEAFEPLAPGDDRSVSFEANGSIIKKIEAPAGLYMVFTDAQGNPEPPKAISDVTIEPFDRPEQTNRGPNDALPVPTPASRYSDNQSLTTLPADSVGRIVPTPISIEPDTGKASLSSATPIYHEEGLASEAERLADALAEVLGSRPPTRVGAPDAGEGLSLRTGTVSLSGDRATGEAAYQLTVDPDAGIEITGETATGVFYGIQSLRTLLPVDPYQQSSTTIDVPAVTVTDAPRFGYRGLHLDVSRNFQSVEDVKRLLDVMALYKLNTFHFHLTDDEGWRLAVDGLPELTEVGGRRGHTQEERDHLIPSYGSGPNPNPAASQGSGWYSSEDYLELVRYARERHIEVIPEIDVPGHARAAIKAMEARTARLQAEGRPEAARRYRLHDPEDASTYQSVQGWDDNVINVCQPSTYRFLTTVVDELQSLHEQADAPLTTVHVGGDEVPAGAWAESPICNRYIEETPSVETVDDLFNHFFQRFQDSLATRDLTMAGWEEVALTDHSHDGTTTAEPNPSFVERDVRPYVWSNIWGTGTEDYAYKLANAGYEVVMSHASNFYFDLAYDKHPAEAGFYWAGFVDNQDPFSFIPYDLYKGADQNLMGHPIDPETAFSDHAQLEASATSNILGLQGQLWGETLRSPDRMEYMAVPRLLSLAERAWAAQPEWATIEAPDRRERERTKAWNEFANRLGQRDLPRLSALDADWTYRLPPPGATIEDGRLQANTALPGLPIRYTTDGSTPTSSSPRYTEPVPVSDDATVRLRTFDGHGRGSRTVVVQP